MKLTGWYQGDQKPVYIGEYERKYADKSFLLAYWDGMCWRYDPRSSICLFQKLPWRGVAK